MLAGSLSQSCNSASLLIPSFEERDKTIGAMIGMRFAFLVTDSPRAHDGLPCSGTGDLLALDHQMIRF